MIGSVGKGVLKGAAIISVFALLGKLLGAVQKLVMAPFIGTGTEADAYTLAFSSIVFIIGMFPQQLLPPLLPLFIEKREREGETAAWRLAGSIGTLLLAALVLTVLLGMLLATPLADAVSSFKSRETTLLAGRLVWVMMPAVLFMGLYAFLALLLQSYKRFSPTPLGDTCNKIVLIACLVALYRQIGIFGLAVGVVLGAATGLVVQLVALRDKLGSFRLRVDWRDPALRQFFLLMLPLLFPFVIAQVRTIIDYKFASGMAAGSTSGIFFARGLVDTLILLGPTALGTAVFPFFSELAVDRARLGDLLLRALRLMVFVCVPVTIALLLLGTPLVQVLFQRGKFTGESVAMTVAPFNFYTLGLTIFALEILLMRFYFSVKNTLAPALIGGACVFVHLGVILMTKDTLQNSSMALAATVSKGVKVAVMLGLLGTMLPSLQFRRNGLFLLKMLGAGAAMAGLMAACLYVPWPEGGGKAMRLILTLARMGVAGGVGAIGFLAASWALKMEEPALMVSLVRKRKRAL